MTEKETNLNTSKTIEAPKPSAVAKSNRRFRFWLLVLFALFLTVQKVRAAEPAPAVPPADDTVEVEKIKEKYWAKGDDSEVGVVQNRLYSKAQRIELGAFFGFTSNDPFLSVKQFGGGLGYHFNEYFSIAAVGWQYSVSSSSALTTFEAQMNSTTNTNKPKSFYGLEGKASLLYGKLSLMGQKIIYFDLHALGGYGMTSTENGSYGTPFIGVGQQIYLNRFFSLNVDYRLMTYSEQIVGRVPGPNYGVNLGSRTNNSSVITLGVSILLNPFGK